MKLVKHEKENCWQNQKKWCWKGEWICDCDMIFAFSFWNFQIRNLGITFTMPMWIPTCFSDEGADSWTSTTRAPFLVGMWSVEKKSWGLCGPRVWGISQNSLLLLLKHDWLCSLHWLLRLDGSGRMEKPASKRPWCQGAHTHMHTQEYRAKHTSICFQQICFRMKFTATPDFVSALPRSGSAILSMNVLLLPLFPEKWTDQDSSCLRWLYT